MYHKSFQKNKLRRYKEKNWKRKELEMKVTGNESN